MKDLIKLGIVAATLGLTACAGVEWDGVPYHHDCVYGYDFYKAKYEAYERARERKIIQGLGGAMYQRD